jgi:hypothetical protein
VNAKPRKTLAPYLELVGDQLSRVRCEELDSVLLRALELIEEREGWRMAADFALKLTRPKVLDDDY